MLDIGLLAVTVWQELICYMTPILSTLAPVKSRLLTFWYQPTRVFLENGH